jgi:hypothetical protein
MILHLQASEIPKAEFPTVAQLGFWFALLFWPGATG